MNVTHSGGVGGEDFVMLSAMVLGRLVKWLKVRASSSDVVVSETSVSVDAVEGSSRRDRS
ncbi:MAG: hypothetical protein ACF8CQ_02835 [Rhodopirellula sp. JB044]|uniref:hypothetical protein n=1 Tax=Rhodopirellula sp. JB044 TaxID=3342844 RepID=UPI00370C07DC